MGRKFLTATLLKILRHDFCSAKIRYEACTVHVMEESLCCFVGALGFEPRIARSQSENVSRYTMPRYFVLPILQVLDNYSTILNVLYIRQWKS